MDFGTGQKSIGNLSYHRLLHQKSLKSVGPLVLELMSRMRKSKMAAGGHLGFRSGPKIDREPPLP